VLLSGIVADTNKNWVPLALNADIGLMHELSPELIINNEDNAFNLGVGLSFSRKNFLGDARKLTLSLSTAAQDITQLISNPSLIDTNVYGYFDTRAIIEQPFLFGRSINTKFETYYTLQKRRSEYNATLFGGKLSFDIELPRFTYLTSLVLGLNLERSKYVFSREYTYNAIYGSARNQNPDAPPELLDSLANVYLGDQTEFPSEKTSSIISIDLGANKTNNLLFPTRGYTLSLLLEDGNSLIYLANKISSNKFNNPLYIKALLNGTFYFPVYESTEDAFGMKFRIGTIQTYKGDKFEIPLNQRFYAGGSNSVRGWKTRDLVPEQNQGTLSSNPTPEEIEGVLLRNIVPGGFFIMEGSLETRNRLVGQLGTALFVDYGNVWNDFRDVQLNTIAVAAGFGLRYYSDFAPFRIDFGFKVYDPDDRRSFFKKSLFKETFEFHFGIGEAF
jgi:outer membrane protein insertion porin family